jgi:hypothetical protein
LTACGGESAQTDQTDQASEVDGAVNSAAVSSDAGTDGGTVAVNPDADAMVKAPVANDSNGRPVLERRVSASAQVVVGRPASSGQASRGSDAASRSDNDPAGHAADHEDGDEDGDAHADDHQGDDADDESDENEDDEPWVDPREQRLAWLAEPWEGQDLPAESAHTSGGGSVARIVLPEEPLQFVRPEAVKGIYLNAWAAGSSVRSQALIDLATRTEVNAFVIDLKDASGYVSYATEVMMAREVGADQEIRIRHLVGLLERLQEANIYPIARIVIVKDPLLIRARPEWAPQDTAGGVWVDSKGLIWANLYDRRVWDYHVDLAKEAAALGFPEIQWDYVRFADAPRADLERAVYAGADGMSRRDGVQAFLEYARAELEGFGVTMTMDVFGATTSAPNDLGIGQYWESFIATVDIAHPMVYPSHYWVGSFGIQDPNGHPYEIVRAALAPALQRSGDVEGAGFTRPWLQDFTLGEPFYKAPEVRAQIQATYDAGIAEWLLWNAGSHYTEAALEPADGYPPGVEPEMRVGGRIVPVSQRFEAMDAEAREQAAAQMLADSIAAVARADSLAVVGGGGAGGRIR